MRELHGDQTGRVDLTIRTRRSDDLPTLVRLLGEQQAASHYPIRWPLPVPTEDFLVRATERRAWVAEDDGEVVGHVTAAHVDGELVPLLAAGVGDRPMGMMSVLFTDATRRGRGIGSLLHDTAVAWIREQGEVPVLDVVPVHAPAVALYRRRGWIEVGRSRFLWMPGDLPDVILMALLSAPAPTGQTPSATSTGS